MTHTDAAADERERLIEEFGKQFQFVAASLDLNHNQRLGYLVACMAVDTSTPSSWTTADRVVFAREVLHHLYYLLEESQSHDAP